MQINNAMVYQMMRSLEGIAHLSFNEAKDSLEAALAEVKPAGVICSGCGSSWDDDRLAEEKAKRPELISCCPERKMITVYAVPSMPHEVSHD